MKLKTALKQYDGEAAKLCRQYKADIVFTGIGPHTHKSLKINEGTLKELKNPDPNHVDGFVTVKELVAEFTEDYKYNTIVVMDTHHFFYNRAMKKLIARVRPDLVEMSTDEPHVHVYTRG